VDYTIANGTLLLVDGSNKIQKYRGSTNSNYTTGTLSVTEDDATVTGSGTSWNTSTNATAGQYIKLPDGKWYKIASISSNTSLEIEVDYQGSTASGQNYTISSWGEVQGDLNSSTIPSGLVTPTGSFIENHQNRIWNLSGNTLRFSALDTSIDGEHFNDWDTPNNAGAIIIPSSKDDTGTGLYSFNGILYIFQRRAIWALVGNAPLNFELRNVSNEIGMTTRKSLVEYDDLLLFLSDLGVYIFDGTNLTNLTDGVINKSINLWASKASVSACLWDNKYLISYTPSGGSSNSEAVFFDLTRKAWGKLEGVYGGVWSNWNGGTDSNQIYFVSSNQGTIYRFDIGGHDDGYEIETRYDTPSLSFTSGINDKALKKFLLQQIALGDWDMTVTQLSDITQGEISGSPINLSTGDSVLWDVAQWDEDSWPSEGTLITTRIAEFQGLAKYFKFRFGQTGYDEGVEILALTTTARERRLG
jgi:hypothetical protein